MRCQQDSVDLVVAGATLKSPATRQGESHAVSDGFRVTVALFNFNRPQMTRRVFDVVRQIKPRRLLLVADGPRESRPDDVRLCAEVRAIFEEIDWDCEVFRNFSDTNLGSFKRNSSGLNWVFDTVEEAIILEDDCVPSLSFFRYCEELLERYRNDPRVGVISGNNFGFPMGVQKNDSYYFSVYALTWGWASWRRVWRAVDQSMSWWEPDAGREMLRNVFPRRTERKYWHGLYESVRRGKIDNAWDYQLILSSIRHAQCCIVPSVNLVSNIGFCADATHTTNALSPMQNFPKGELEFPLAHPADVRRCSSVDYAIFRIRIKYSLWRKIGIRLSRVFRRAKRIIGRES